MSFLISTAGVLFAFGLVIFVHEFGHFLVAKKSGVKVEQFSFGFGKEIFGFQWGETRYTLNWIPLGGFVKMAGETPEDYKGPAFEGKSNVDPANADHSRDFMAQPWYRRFMIAIAGPFMNYLLSSIIFFLMLSVWGEPIQTNRTQVGEVMPGKPAAAAGIKPGDHVLSVNGEKVEDFLEVALKIHGRPEQATEVVVKREDQELKFTVVPEKDTARNNVGIIGIRPATPIQDHKEIGVVDSAKKAVWQCWNISRFTLYYLGQKIVAREKPDVAGPIGITQVIVKAVKTGWEDFFFLIAMISVAIGLFNLFPIPLLDGGHMLYYLIEGITGRPVSEKVMSKANMVGFALLMSLFVFATFNDIQRIYTDKAAKTAATATPSPSPTPAQPK
jgi:regulator of sigma E protease